MVYQKLIRRTLVFVFLAVLAGGSVSADEPVLPAGLGDAPAEPAPPPGLDSGTSGPSLPAGLGGEPGPSLPEGLGGVVEAGEQPAGEEKKPFRERLPFDLYGYWEVRGGIRLQDDPAMPDDATIGETRLQLKAKKFWDNATLEVTSDFYLDGVEEKAKLDLREVRLTFSPLPSVDVRVGRQVLTWGTGDMLFINDTFPKDWQAFFIGRDEEYLKAPSDSLRVGWYNDFMNVEFVYTPQFAHDRFIRGERISYWNPLIGTTAGEKFQADYNAPSDWFEDDEFNLRLYRNFGSAEFALYAYSGYWKSPGGQRLIPLGQAAFPKLSVYGASLRGNVGPGIGNIEIGYYDSRQDRHGDNPFINNSEFRLLIGYEQELAKEFTGAIQYYLEHIMDYGAYENTLLFFQPKRDQDRHLITLRFTKLLMQQRLTLSLFGYFSPSDIDAYIRPKATYKISDAWMIEGGANVFLGEDAYSFFGQFEDNTNVYAAARYSF